MLHEKEPPMAHIVLWIATSLDGYIADKNGSIDWLNQINNFGDDYGYHEFLDSVDLILMGKTTYEKVRALGTWPYDDKQTFVFSEEPLTSPQENISFVSGSVEQFIDQLNETNADASVWLVGGANLIAQFEKARLIDEYIITKAPQTLGEGLKLSVDEEELIPQSEVKYPNGVVQKHYSN